MISAVDTNVLLDLLLGDPEYADASEQRLNDAADTGTVVISEPVYAELSPRFPDSAGVDRFLALAGVHFESSTRPTLHRAGTAWRAYARRRPRMLVCTVCGEPQTSGCEACGAMLQVRQHVLADFLIGTHATVQADRLITRDRGYYSTYFPDLELA